MLETHNPEGSNVSSCDFTTFTVFTAEYAEQTVIYRIQVFLHLSSYNMVKCARADNSYILVVMNDYECAFDAVTLT